MIELPLIDRTAADKLRELYFELGRSLLAAGHNQEAIEILKLALESEGPAPETWKIYYVLGRAHQADLDNNQSIQAYLQAVAEKPESSTAILPFAHPLLTRATAAQHEQWMSSALGELPKDDHLDLDNRVEILVILGRTQIILKNYLESLRLFEYGYQIKPDDTYICEGLGESLYRNGKTEKAMEMIQKAAALAEKGNAPERADIIAVRMVRILVNQGQFQGALEKIETIQPTQKYDFELLILKGTCQLGLGEIGNALELAERALQEDPSSILAKMLKIRTLIANHEYAKAISTADESLTRDPTNIDLAQLKIQASIEGQKNAEQAFQTLDRTLKRKGLHIEQVEDYLESPFMKSRSEDGNAQYFIAKVHYHFYPHWTLKQTLEEVNRAIELGISGDGEGQYADIDAYLLKADIHERKRQKVDAAEAYFNAARSYYRLNDNQNAAKTFERSLELNPDQAMAWWYLADAYRVMSYTEKPPYVNEEKIIKSLESWNQTISKTMYPNKDESWVYLSRAYISEQLNQLPKRDKKDELINYWTAISYAEKAYLHRDESFRLGILARYLRFPDLNMNALLASQQAFEKNKDDLTILQEYVGALINLGMFDDAKPHLDTIIDRYTKDDNEASANYYKGWKGMIHFFKAEFDQALEMMNHSLKLDEGALWNRNVRAAIYAHKHDFENAKQDYAWILETENDPKYPTEPIYYAWATINLGFDDFDLLDESIRYSKQALQNPDDEYDAYMNLCHIYLVRSEFNKAQECMDKALELVNSPRALANAEMDLNLMVWMSESKGWSNRKEIQHEISKTGGLLDQVVARNDALKRKLTERPVVILAIEELSGIEIPIADPERELVTIAQKAGLARLNLENKQFDAAVEAYRWLSDPERDFPEAVIGLENAARRLMELAIEQHNAGEDVQVQQLLDQSEELLVELLEDNPENDSTIYQLADHYFRTLNRSEKAFNLFMKIREIKGEANEASYQNRVGNIYYSQKDYKEAKRHYQKAIDADPSQAVYFSNMGLALRDMGEWEQSRDYYQIAYEINRNEDDYKRAFALAYNGEGNEYFGKQQYDKAVETYTKAIEHDPLEAVFYSNTGLALRGLSQWEQSRQYYQKAYEINKDEAEYKRAIALAYNGEGNEYIEAQQYQNAVESYTKAIEYDPSEPVFYSNMGLALRGLGAWEEARGYFQKAYGINQAEADYNRFMALVYNDEGNARIAAQQYHEAQEVYAKAIEHDPSEAVFYSNMGLALGGLEQWDECRRYYLKAFEINGAEADYKKAIALTYNGEGNKLYQSENYQEAIEAYTNAIEADPGNAVFYANIGMSQMGLTNWQGAVEYFEKALELDEGNEEYTQYMNIAQLSLAAQGFLDNPHKDNN